MNAVMAPESRFGIRPFKEVTGQRGRYTRHGEDYIDRFHKLLRRWRADTAYVSSATEMFNHPAFAQIVRMGKQVVPLIIAELRMQPDWLVGALVRITGENPVPEADRGDVYAMANAWVEWHNRRR
jgi:hypothetical protein